MCNNELIVEFFVMCLKSYATKVKCKYFLQQTYLLFARNFLKCQIMCEYVSSVVSLTENLRKYGVVAVVVGSANKNIFKVNAMRFLRQFHMSVPQPTYDMLLHSLTPYQVWATLMEKSRSSRYEKHACFFKISNALN